MIRILIEEEKQTADGVQWQVIVNATTDDAKIIAGALRAAADKYDPPHRPHR